jgi:hypothetical protein
MSVVVLAAPATAHHSHHNYATIDFTTHSPAISSTSVANWIDLKAHRWYYFTAEASLVDAPQTASGSRVADTSFLTRKTYPMGVHQQEGLSWTTTRHRQPEE